MGFLLRRGGHAGGRLLVLLALVLASAGLSYGQKGPKTFTAARRGISLTRLPGWHLATAGRDEEQPETPALLDGVLNRTFFYPAGGTLLAGMLPDTLTSPYVLPLVAVCSLPADGPLVTASADLTTFINGIITDPEFTVRSPVRALTVGGQPGATARLLLRTTPGGAGDFREQHWGLLLVRRHRDDVLVYVRTPAAVPEATVDKLLAQLAKALSIQPDQPLVLDRAVRPFADTHRGVSLTKPAGWYFEEEDLDEAPDPALVVAVQHDTLEASGGRLLLRIMHYVRNSREQPAASLREALPDLRGSLNRFQLLREVHDTTFQNLPAATLTIGFMQTDGDTGEVPGVMQMLMVANGPQMFNIIMAGPQQTAGRLRPRLDQLLRTIRFTHATDAAATEDLHFTDALSGVRLTRPQGWMFVYPTPPPAPAAGKTKKARKAPKDTDEYRELVRIQEFDVPEGLQSPRLVLIGSNIDDAPHLDLTGQLGKALPLLRKSLGTCTPIDGVRAGELGGQAAAVVRLRCAASSKGGAPYTLALWVVRHRSRLVYLTLIDSNPNPDTGATDFQTILKSLQFAD